MPLEGGLLATFGLKFGTVIAGLMGALGSLLFIREVEGWRAILLVIAGVSFSVYTTPVTMHYFGIPMSDSWEHGVAYMSGLFGMMSVAAVMKIIESIKNNPERILEALLNVVKKKGE